MLRLGIALLALGIGGTALAAGESGGLDELERKAEHGPSPSSTAKRDAGSAAKKRTAKAVATRSKRTKSRRGARQYKFSGGVVPEEKLRSSPPPPPSGNLHLQMVGSDEALKVSVFNPDGSYSVDALQTASHMLRCKRTGAEREIEPRLLTVLSHVYDQYGGRPIEVVSGYRNQRRTSSHHYKGSAVDIRVPGVKPGALRAFVESLDAGGMGIGLYPRTGFVHIDVRPQPSYRWIDYSPADPDSPDKRPPRGVSRKKRLQS
jgi:uncharacterized protein YcbK (DUF882 family)